MIDLTQVKFNVMFQFPMGIRSFSTKEATKMEYWHGKMFQFPMGIRSFSTVKTEN